MAPVGNVRCLGMIRSSGTNASQKNMNQAPPDCDAHNLFGAHGHSRSTCVSRHLIHLISPGWLDEHVLRYIVLAPMSCLLTSTGFAPILESPLFIPTPCLIIGSGQSTGTVLHGDSLGGQWNAVGWQPPAAPK